VPAVAADRISVGPFFAAVLPLIGVSKHSRNASHGSGYGCRYRPGHLLEGPAKAFGTQLGGCQAAFVLLCKDNCKSRDRTEARVIYEFGMQNFAAIRRFQENLDAAASTSRSLPRLLTVGLVASLEYHLNLIMKEIAARNPEAIFGREKMLPVREAVKFDSMEELKEFVINDEIDKAQRENFESQVSWIVSKSNMDDFTSNYPDWPNILELFERRNLFVHANGVVNRFVLKGGRQRKIS
jgi:hypothetical protein